MILHPDGRVEGTPEEVAAYKREMHPKIMLTEPKYEREVQYTAAKLEEIKQQTENTSVNTPKELTEEQVSSLSTYRLVDELSRRTGVKHIAVLHDDELKLQVANEKRLSVRQRDAEEFADWKYILIERD